MIEAVEAARSLAFQLAGAEGTIIPGAEVVTGNARAIPSGAPRVSITRPDASAART